MDQVTSQHPYAEDFISEPHVYTVDMDNLVAVEETIKKALASIDDNKVRPIDLQIHWTDFWVHCKNKQDGI